MRHLSWLLAVALFATGCPTRDQEPAASGGNPGSGSTGRGGSVGSAGGGGLPPPPNTVTITSPTKVKRLDE